MILAYKSSRITFMDAQTLINTLRKTASTYKASGYVSHKLISEAFYVLATNLELDLQQQAFDEKQQQHNESLKGSIGPDC